MDEINVTYCDCDIRDNTCYLKIPIAKRVKNILNCDVCINEKHLIFCADNELHKFALLHRQFDLKDMKNILINFNTSLREFRIELPCFPEITVDDPLITNVFEENTIKPERFLDLTKMHFITDSCSLFVEGQIKKFDANFAYGFASRYNGEITCAKNNVPIVCRILSPAAFSPIKRTIHREIDELQDFSREQYKLNFIELQVPEGHENPMKYIPSYQEVVLTRDEKFNLHNISKTNHFKFFQSDNLIEVDCGLVSVLLAICYDLRSTLNYTSCESSWTRAILSPCFAYFERFDNLKLTVESFMRRTLIYPLYRSYDLSRKCVQDAVTALQKGPSWIIKQLLYTHEIFALSDYNLDVLNKYYIEDYLRYLSSSKINSEHLELLSNNLKNVLSGMTKSHLRLNLIEIETELLKEIIHDIHIVSNESDDDDESPKDKEDSAKDSSGSASPDNTSFKKDLNDI